MKHLRLRTAIVTAAMWFVFATLGVLAAERSDLLVASSVTNSVLKFDGATGKFLETFVTSGSGGLDVLQGITIGPDRNLYAASWNNGSVKRYDGQTGAYLGDFVASGSGGLANPDTVLFGPDGNLYVSDRFSGWVLRYNGQTGAFIGTFVQDERLYGFLNFTFGPDKNLYASMFNCCAQQRILRFNGTTGAFIDAFNVGLPTVDAAYSGLTFGNDGKLYASRYHASRIERFDPTTADFVDLFVLAGSGGLSNPRDLTFGPDGNLYVVSQGSHAVLRFNGTTGAFIDVFASGGGLNQPTSLVFMKRGLPFASFTPRIIMKFGRKSTDDAFEVMSSFTLNASSDGIDPITENVGFQLGAFSITIPTGSFVQDGNGVFRFEGIIDKVKLKVKIMSLGNQQYKFRAEGERVNLNGTLVPLNIKLTIGDDEGKTNLTTGKAEFREIMTAPCDVIGDGKC